MPYEIVRQGNRYFVKKKDSGKVIGRHDTKQKAEAQIRALYANETKS